jgi:hypothetical protein
VNARLPILLSLAIATAAIAQVSPEEAQRRLEERRAQAVTRPATVDAAAVIADLKFQIARLRQEIDRLKAENAVLTAHLADAQAAAAAATAAASATSRPAAQVAAPLQGEAPPPATEPTAAATSVKPTGKLSLGMTVQQANAAMGFDGKLVGEGRGWQQYEWQLPGKSSRTDTPAPGNDRPRSLLGADNTISGPSVFARFESGSLTSYAKR